MTHRIATADLAHREYWSPAECARVLGRGADWWAEAYDAGRVTGYAEPKQNGKRRYIRAASARAYLDSLCVQLAKRWNPAEFRRELDSDPEFQSLSSHT